MFYRKRCVFIILNQSFDCKRFFLDQSFVILKSSLEELNATMTMCRNMTCDVSFYWQETFVSLQKCYAWIAKCLRFHVFIILLLRSLSQLLLSTAWPLCTSGQVLSSHSIVSSSQIVSSCSPWGGRWTLKEDMVGGLFHCATLTGGRGCHTAFVQVGTETPDTQNGRQKVFTRGVCISAGGLTFVLGVLDI